MLGLPHQMVAPLTKGAVVAYGDRFGGRVPGA